MASTSSGVMYGAATRAGALANVQYPHRSRHNIVSGTNTLGENVTRVPNCASRTDAAAVISSVNGVSSSSSRLGESPMVNGTLVLAQRRSIAQPDHPFGPDSRAREIVAGPDPLDGFALVRAGNRDDDQASARDRGKGERQARLRVRVVAGRDHQPLGFVERGAARKERRGVAVGAETEVHDVDGRRGAHEGVVPARR